MPYVLYTSKAESHLQELIDDQQADDYLLDRLEEQFQAIAEQPSTLTEPAKLPYPPNRLMANFFLNDSAARRWGFTITLRRTPDEDGIEILTIAGAPYPDSSDDDLAEE